MSVGNMLLRLQKRDRTITDITDGFLDSIKLNAVLDHCEW